MKLLGPAQLEDWLPALTLRTGRVEDDLRTHGLQVPDFSMPGIVVKAEDGAMLHFPHALAVRRSPESCDVAIFTEHNGYWALALSPDDELHELTGGAEPEPQRWPGKHHCVPFSPCPLCGGEVDVVEYPAERVYELNCPDCGLTFGQPHGYGSCLSMARDWNRRTDTVTSPAEMPGTPGQ